MSSSRQIVLLSGDRRLAVDRSGPLRETLDGIAPVIAAAGVSLVVLPIGPGWSSLPFELEHGVEVLPVPAPRRERRRRLRVLLGELLDRVPTTVVTHDYGLCEAARVVSSFTEHPHLACWISEVHHLAGRPFVHGGRLRIERWIVEHWLARIHRRVTYFRCVEGRHVPARLLALGVPREKLALVPAVYLDLEESHGVQERASDLDVLFVGRWSPEKGVHLLVEALRQLASRRALHVGAVGAGVPHGLRWSLRGVEGLRIEAHEQVSRQDLIGMFGRARLLLCPSLCEGGPRVAAEALAAGTPVVGTRVGRLEEWIREPTCGRLVAPTAESIVAAVGDLWEREVDPQRVREEALPGLSSCARSRALAEYAQFLLTPETARRLP